MFRFMNTKWWWLQNLCLLKEATYISYWKKSNSVKQLVLGITYFIFVWEVQEVFFSLKKKNIILICHTFPQHPVYLKIFLKCTYTYLLKPFFFLNILSRLRTRTHPVQPPIFCYSNQKQNKHDKTFQLFPRITFYKFFNASSTVNCNYYLII